MYEHYQGTDRAHQRACPQVQGPGGLTEEERWEQADLRRRYIDSVKANLVGQLDNTYVVDGQGNKRKLEKKE